MVRGVGSPARTLLNPNEPDSHALPATAPPYWEEACSFLAQHDPVMERVIATHREGALSGSGVLFQTLVKAITGQQISVLVADRIWERLHILLPALSPDATLAASAEDLRKTGLSWRKVEYIHGIAHALTSGAINPEAWPEMPDGAIKRELQQLRGIGPWTADMVLIFYLQRPDVLPLEDIGLINSAFNLYRWEDPGTPASRRARVAAAGEHWKPYRTVATWYIWRVLDATPVIY